MSNNTKYENTIQMTCTERKEMRAQLQARETEYLEDNEIYSIYYSARTTPSRIKTVHGTIKINGNELG